MWWIIIIVILVVVIFKINSEHKEHVATHITRFGGMTGKYNQVIEYLQAAGSKIQKVTKESVVLGTKSMVWSLDYVGNNLEIRMKGFLPILGNVSKKWVFPDGYSQERIIADLQNYAEWQMEQLRKAAENNPYQHLNL